MDNLRVRVPLGLNSSSCLIWIGPEFMPCLSHRRPVSAVGSTWLLPGFWQCSLMCCSSRRGSLASCATGGVSERLEHETPGGGSPTAWIGPCFERWCVSGVAEGPIQVWGAHFGVRSRDLWLDQRPGPSQRDVNLLDSLCAGYCQRPFRKSHERTVPLKFQVTFAPAGSSPR
jgi:hypothetical protein